MTHTKSNSSDKDVENLDKSRAHPHTKLNSHLDLLLVEMLGVSHARYYEIPGYYQILVSSHYERL